MQTLTENSLNILAKTSEGAARALDDDMTDHWSNIGSLGEDIGAVVERYLDESGLTVSDLYESQEKIAVLDEEFADSMLGTLRFSNANGVFVVFSNGDDGSNILSGEPHHGLHFRDLDPTNNPSDYSDIILERGHNDISADRGIPVDVYWRPDYTIREDNKHVFDMLIKPIEAAKENPGLPASAYGYWGPPRVLSNDESGTDTYTYITYSMPIFVGDEIIGVVGSEVQVSLIKSEFFPVSDFDTIGQGGFMLASYKKSEIAVNPPHSSDALSEEKSLLLNPYILTGEAASDIFSPGVPTAVYKDVYEPWHMVTDNIYVYNRLHDEAGATSHMSIYSLDLYPDDSPFADEVWAVAGISPDTSLFATASHLWSDVLKAATLSVTLALLFCFIIVRLAVNPLKTLTESVKRNSSNAPIPSPKNFDVKEIAVLRGALNESYRRSQSDKKRLSEEQERYKLALSLATGTLLEYSPDTDITKISRFGIDSDPFVWTVEHTRKRMRDGEFVHPEDEKKISALFTGEPVSPVTARINMAFLPRAIFKSDNEYAWIRFSCKTFFDEHGNFLRLIGTTLDVSEEEYRRERELLRMRTDPTTKLFNREYGLSRCAEAILKAKEPLLLLQIQLEPALLSESYYGLFYTNVIHFMVAEKLREIAPEGSVLVRGGDNEIFALIPPESLEINHREIIERIHKSKDSIYFGENKDLELSITIGAAKSLPGITIYDLAGRTNAAVQSLSDKIFTGGGYVYFSELPEEIRKPLTYIPTPITFNSDIASMSVAAIAFNLFERTKDTSSVINMLSRIAAKRFNLSRVFIVENDMDFLTNTITYSFVSDGTPPITDRLSRVPREYYSDFDSFAHGEGMHIVTSLDNASDSIKTLLRVGNLSDYSVFACGMYVNGELAGKIVFTHADPRFVWTEAVIKDLNEVTKIITSHLSRAKSDTASKAKTEFLSKISHEIRTPMNAILGLSDIARKAETDGNSDRALDCLNKIDSSAKFLLTIINDVLDMSKIESGKVSLQIAPADLKEAVEDVCGMIRPMIERSGMDFLTEINILHKNVFCDAPRIKQVLTNLLGNAVKFTEAGYISLNVTETDNDYYFSVTDTGVGISEEDSKRVFDSFVQLDSSEKVYGGTGLGLSISSRIVKLMGGTIEVSSELGRGSKFFFTIPLKQSGAVEPDPEDHAPKNYEGFFTGKNALLVEDNELNTEIAVAILEDAGFRVVTAENGKIGADEYTGSSEGFFDVILMDIRMPVLDGLGATRLIRQNESHSDARTIPIVAMTANAFDEDMKKSMDAGMSGYLPKPIDVNLLYKLLDTLLSPKKDETDDSGQVV
jgi:signal transduction histidine kinase/CheY-like chemotaxis protein/GGDEF domain-containing protein